MSVSRDFIDSYSPEAPRRCYGTPLAATTAGKGEFGPITLVFGFQHRIAATAFYGPRGQPYGLAWVPAAGPGKELAKICSNR
jgi:hypothetical protein